MKPQLIDLVSVLLRPVEPTVKSDLYPAVSVLVEHGGIYRGILSRY